MKVQGIMSTKVIDLSLKLYPTRLVDNDETKGLIKFLGSFFVFNGLADILMQQSLST